MTKQISEYFEGIGRRKESVARVRVTRDSKAGFIINDKEAKIFFPVKKFQMLFMRPWKQQG